MTFGKALRKFMNCADMKQTQLADHLGYDVSYISRWLSDAKLPSARSSSSLFKSIIRFLLKDCSDDCRNAVCKAFAINPALSDEAFESRCIAVLADSYKESSSHMAKPAPGSASGYTNNCHLSQLEVSFEYNNSLLARLTSELAAHSAVPVLECISIPFTSDYGNNECIPFWRNILQELPKGSRLHLRMLADISDCGCHIKICRDICSFYGALKGNVCVEFYNIDRSLHSYESLLVFQNELCVITYQDGLLGARNVLITQEPVVTERYYGAANYLLRGQLPLIVSSGFHTLYERKYFQSFFTSPRLFSLHTAMPVFFVDMESLTPVLTRCGTPKQILDMYAYYEKTLSRWTVFIYKSAVVHFLFDGELDLFLDTVTLSEQERRDYIAGLIRKLSEGNRLVVIDDVNPVLGREELDFSLFLSDRSMFLVPHGEESSSAVRHSADGRIIACFEHLAAALYSLPAHSAMQGKDVIQFLRQSMELI